MIRTLILGGALLFVAVFGVSAGAPKHLGHEHCPYAPVDSALCATLVAHIHHWQSSTTGLTSLFVLVFVASTLWILFSIVRLCILRRKLLATTSQRPTLSCELFASGLLHPRIP